jgi:hypothetical protein
MTDTGLSAENAKAVLDSITGELKTLRDLVFRGVTLVTNAYVGDSSTEESRKFVMDTMRFMLKDFDDKEVLREKLGDSVLKPTRPDISGTA